MVIVDTALSLRSGDRSGATPSRVRNYNERLVLSVVKNHGPIASSHIAQLTSLSAQTASVITRSLLADGMVVRGEPVRSQGKVGKPSSPVALNPEGALAFGLRVGRRAADIVLMNIVGGLVDSRTVSYDYPLPHPIEQFAQHSIEAMTQSLGPELRSRIVGIGVATPHGIWKLPEETGAPKDALEAWKDHSFETSFASFTDMNVFTANDASMACSGEFVFGKSGGMSDFIYFYIGAFVGGGLVLDGRVFLGRTGNAAAFGSLPINHIDARPNQLVQGASIYVLERALSAREGRSVRLRSTSDAWTIDDPIIAAWVEQTGRSLAVAAVGVSASVDVHTVIIDGNFPAEIKQATARHMEDAINQLEISEIGGMSVALGSLGRSAGAMGAAYQPITAAHFIEGSAIGVRV
ncbi:MAG: ROK family transcriptional regulator [Pseudomonadota bacterium]